MIELPKTSGDFEFIIILVILFLVGLARQLEGGRISLFIASFLNGNLADQQLRQERAFSRMALFAFLFVLLTISTFLAISSKKLGFLNDLDFLALFAIICIGLFLLTTARVAIYALVSWVFELDKLQQQHTYHWLLTNVIGSILILPILIFTQFGPLSWIKPLILSGLVFMAIINGVRILRTMYIARTVFSIEIGYYFIYICALEILPIAMSISVVLRQIGG